MARVKIEAVIDYMSHDIRKALEDTVRRNYQGSNHNSHQLFRDFKRAIGRKCRHWENIPDHLVEKD